MVVYMNSMFNDATAFNQDLSEWAVAQVLDNSFMFQGAGFMLASVTKQPCTPSGVGDDDTTVWRECE